MLTFFFSPKEAENALCQDEEEYKRFKGESFGRLYQTKYQSQAPRSRYPEPQRYNSYDSQGEWNKPLPEDDIVHRPSNGADAQNSPTGLWSTSTVPKNKGKEQRSCKRPRMSPDTVNEITDSASQLSSQQNIKNKSKETSLGHLMLNDPEVDTTYLEHLGDHSSSNFSDDSDFSYLSAQLEIESLSERSKTADTLCENVATKSMAEIRMATGRTFAGDKTGDELQKCHYLLPTRTSSPCSTATECNSLKEVTVLGDDLPRIEEISPSISIMNETSIPLDTCSRDRADSYASNINCSPRFTELSDSSDHFQQLCKVSSGMPQLSALDVDQTLNSLRTENIQSHVRDSATPILIDHCSDSFKREDGTPLTESSLKSSEKSHRLCGRCERPRTFLGDLLEEEDDQLS